MKKVTMTHPALVDKDKDGKEAPREIRVFECAVPHHERSGWQVKKDDAKPSVKSTTVDKPAEK